MCISKETEKKLIRAAFKLSKLGAGVVTLLAIIASEIIYLIITLSLGIKIHPIGYIAACLTPAITAYPTLWILLRVTEIVKEQNEEIEMKNNLKNTLLSVVAHDVRGPIMNIDSLIDLYLMKEIDQEELLHLLKELQQQVKTNLDFVMNILQWTKTQFDGFQVIKTPVDLKLLLGKIIDAYQFQIEQKKLKIETDVDLTALIDRDLMRLILRNLLSNAIKFSETGGIIRITAQIENGLLITKVIDNGLGISKEQISNLFNEKVLGSSKGTYLETGTGLGLKLCNTFIHAMGGRIGVESEPGKGSTFYFSVPQ